MNKKKFYDNHKNFSFRTLSEYYISPGIRCKFDLLKDEIGSKKKFKNGIDLGCSGNSFLYFLENFSHKSFLDIAHLPLKQYSQKIFKKLKSGDFVQIFHPLCGDITRLPYRNNSFNFVSALDVLEHIKNDELAVSEISRILKKNGLLILSVPNRMKFYTYQDQLIGHYRRYEIEQINSLFKKYNLIRVKSFGVYGKFMKIADFQSINPKKTEKKLLKLRDRYESDFIFRNIWDIIVKIGAKLMKIDAKYHSFKNIMNMGYVLIKK